MVFKNRFSILLVLVLLASALTPQAALAAESAKKKKKAKAATTAPAKTGGKSKSGAKAASSQAPAPPAKFTKPMPYLTFKGDPTRSIIVNWWNPTATGDSTVAYGPTADYGATAANPEVTNYHHVELTGLTPGATYHYQIRSSDGTAGEDNTFSIPAENQTDFMFAVFGDNRGDGKIDDVTVYHPRHTAEANHIAAKKPALTLNIGDIANKGSSLDDMLNYFICEQNMLKGAPSIIAMGNHEVQGGGEWPKAYYFYELFTPVYPTNGTPGSSGKPTALGMNFSFDYGNAHFVILASYKMSAASQVAWLEQDLAAARQRPQIKWLFAAMHAPMYSWVEGHPADEKELAAWGPVFDKYHVDVVFGGHNHLYERTHVIKGSQVVASEDPAAGTIYLTTGLGGGPFNVEAPADPKYPFILKNSSNKTATAFVHVQGTKLAVEVRDVDDTLVDSFEITKP